MIIDSTIFRDDYGEMQVLRYSFMKSRVKYER